MSDVLAIPGVATVHPRSSWVDPAWPVTGPATPWADIDTGVIHYTAADDLIDGDPGEHAANLPAYIRSMQKAYAKPVAQGGRGYSLGYWWAVDWLGGAWQIRGWEFKSAANAGHNDHTGPILALVDGNDAATPEAAETIRCIIAEGQRRAGRAWAVKGHGQLRRETGVGTATACCGIGLQAQVTAGVFSPRPTPAPIPTPDPIPPIPDTEDDDMATAIAAIYQPTPALIARGLNKSFALLPNGDVRHASGPDVAYAKRVSLPVEPIEGDEHYGQCVELDAVWRSRA